MAPAVVEVDSTSELRSDPQRDRSSGPNDVRTRQDPISPFLTSEQLEKVAREVASQRAEEDPGVTSTRPEIKLSGVYFRVSKKEETVVLEHPRWLIRVAGSDVTSAEKALFNKAKAVAEIYACRMDEEHTTEFEELRKFVLNHGVQKPRPSADTVITNVLAPFAVLREGEIRAFIKKHPHLYFFLDSAPVHIEEYFPDSELRLELYRDPEGQMSDEVAIYISTDLAPDEALDRLSELDRTWWLEAAQFSGEHASLNLEYR